MLQLLKIWVFTAVLISSPLLRAHDDHDLPPLDDFYSSLGAVFEQYLNSPENEEDIVEINGKTISHQAMLALVSLAVQRMHVHSHDHEESVGILQHILATLRGVPMHLIVPHKSILRIMNYIQVKLLEAERGTHRLLLAYSPLIFVVIAVSQGAWETLESTIMPAGIHMACTHFNLALLAAVLPFEYWLEHLQVKNNFSWLQRPIGAIQFGIDKLGFLWRKKAIARLSLKEPKDLDEWLKYWLMPVDSKVPIDPTKLLAMVKSEIKLMVNPKLIAHERKEVVFMHGQMLHLLNRLLTATSEEQFQHLGRRNNLPLKRVQGRLDKITAMYIANSYALARNPAAGSVGDLLTQFSSILDLHSQLGKWFESEDKNPANLKDIVEKSKDVIHEQRVATRGYDIFRCLASLI
jgi:hypothetical protein